jgi:hypothetical protein
VTRATTALALAVAVALAGCQDPYANDGSRPEPARRRTAPAPADTAEPEPAAIPARAIVRSFAMRWINWDWRTAANQERDLARLATAKLGRTLRANAASARIDATVARDKPGSRGTVAAIELKTTGAVTAGLVVTREQSSTDGHADLGGRRYRVYLVALELEDENWEVSRWAPQP